MVDLRSDTVTRPTQEMRRVMCAAEVGDDVFGEDPTARRLEARVAELLGKEAALFVPSGVMGNQIALKLHTEPGDEVILDESSHIFNHEAAASAVLSGVQLRTVKTKEGVLSADDVSAVIRAGHYWEPQSRLVCMENTVNQTGGVIYPLEDILDVASVARERGLRLHLDGARLWHASIATGIPEAEYAAPFDTVSVCFSKGLGAPVGSMLAGSSELIKEARRYRKLFGGGMRQIGILAAAALYAVDNHRQLLEEDHRKAHRIARAISELPGFSIDLERVTTNIIIFETELEAEQVVNSLREKGILVLPFGPRTVRAVLHRDVSESDVDRCLSVLPETFAQPQPHTSIVTDTPGQGNKGKGHSIA